MNNLASLAVFDTIFDIKFNLLKSMLDEAGIWYITSNENARSVKPALSMIPTNVTIEIKVQKENFDEAVEILKSIQE